MTITQSDPFRAATAQNIVHITAHKIGPEKSTIDRGHLENINKSKHCTQNVLAYLKTYLPSNFYL